jgi:Protein of unknown function (DUF3617)
MKLRIRKNWLMVTALAGAIAPLAVLAADGLNVKTGTWETTMSTKTSGMSMPAEAMANMNEQQRAQMAAMMKNMGGAAPKTMVQKSCVTEKDLKEGAFRARQDKDNPCTYKPVAGSGKHQEMTFECPSKRGVTTGHMIVDATDSSNVKGEMHIKAESVTIDSTFTSKWLGPTCADADK